MPRVLPKFFSRVASLLDRREKDGTTVAHMVIDESWQGAFRAEDQFVVSFPRSGNTWLLHLLRELITMRRPEHAAPENMLSLLPAVHKPAAAAPLHEAFGLPGRIFKSHNIAGLLGRRMVYLLREPADALVSYYHFAQRRVALGDAAALPCTPDEFCRKLLPEWCEHLELALSQRHQFPAFTHFTTYESLQREPAGTLGRIVDFLGIASTPAQIAAAIERCSFTRLKSRERALDTAAPEKPFFRKGRVGAGAEELQAGPLQEIQQRAGPLYARACEIADSGR
jgi:hypothetical protein